MKLLLIIAGCFAILMPGPSDEGDTREIPEELEPIIYTNDWEDVRLKGLNLIRLEVPGGWFVREGIAKMAFLGEAQTRMMVFVPDPDHEWDYESEREWEILRLEGLNLHRIRVPFGWLVREGWGKIAANAQTNMIVYLSDPEHEWIVEAYEGP